MILWSQAVGASGVNFVVSQLYPNTGYVYSKLDCLLHDLTSFDYPEQYTLASDGKFPSPVVDVYWAYLNESLLPDGTYLAQCTPVGGGSVTSYAFNVVGGVERFGTLPAGAAPTVDLCLVSGRELDPSGRPLRGVRIKAMLQDGSTSLPSGAINGMTWTESGVDGAWSLSLIPSIVLKGEGRYFFRKEAPGIPTEEYRDVYIPSARNAFFDTVISLSTIKGGEITPSSQDEPPDPQVGYTRMVGRIVDVTGTPMAGVPVTVGVDHNFGAEYGRPAGSYGQSDLNLQVKAMTTAKVLTTPNLLLTKSAYPGAAVTSFDLPRDSVLVAVLDGHGAPLARSRYTYDPLTGKLTFTVDFVGLVKYRVPSDGKFSVVLKGDEDYWVQVGENTIRRSFRLPITADGTFDIGELTLGLFKP